MEASSSSRNDDAVERAARQWSSRLDEGNPTVPDVMGPAWQVLREHADVPLQRLAEGHEWRLCDALLTLHAIATVIRWHRCGFARFWAWKSRGSGRPPVAPDVVPVLGGLHMPTALRRKTPDDQRSKYRLRPQQPPTSVSASERFH
jgi:hypothetical protein